MSDQVKRDPLLGMIDFAYGCDDSSDEEELRSAGVDVDAFLDQVLIKVREVEDNDRLARLRAARRLVGQQEHASRTTSQYADLSRNALMAQLRTRPTAMAQSFFHKLEALSDDDLRVMLEDLDEIEHPED